MQRPCRRHRHIVLCRRVQFPVEKLDKHVRERIEERLKRLAENQVPSDAKFIGRIDGDKFFRYRVGDYRALYKVEEKRRSMLITKIDKRPQVYELKIHFSTNTSSPFFTASIMI